MKSTQILLGVGVLSIALPVLALPALATPFKDATGAVHFQTGLTASQKINLELTGTPVTKKIKANQCGLLTIGAPSTSVPMPGSISVAGSAIDTTSLAVAGTPKCSLNSTSGQYELATPVTSNFRTTTGSVVLVSQTPGAEITVEYTGINKIKSVTANKCGLAKLGSTSSPAPATFKFDGTDYNTASLQVKVPDRCIQDMRFTPVL